MVAVLGTTHPLTSKTHLQPRDFAEEHLITYDIPDEELSINQEFLYPAGITPRKRSKVQLSEAILAMVKAGLGVTVMAEWAIQPEMANGSVVTRPLSKSGIRRKWYAATLRETQLTEPLNDFIHLLAEKSSPARCFAA